MDHSLIHENITKYGSKTRNGKEREGEIIAFSLNNWKQWQKFQKFVTKARLMRATIIFFFAHQQLVIARKILATMLQHSLQNTFFFEFSCSLDPISLWREVHSLWQVLACVFGLRLRICYGEFLHSFTWSLVLVRWRRLSSLWQVKVYNSSFLFPQKFPYNI